MLPLHYERGVSFIAVSNGKWPRVQIVDAKKKKNFQRSSTRA